MPTSSFFHVEGTVGLEMMSRSRNCPVFRSLKTAPMAATSHDCPQFHSASWWLVQSEPDLLIAGPGDSGQLGIDCPQPFIRNGVRLTECLHLETPAFLLWLDLLWGWLNLCVGAMSLLTCSLLLPWPSRRHHAWELFRDRTRGLCLSSAVAVVTPVCCCTSRKDSVLVSKCSCVRTQALLGLKPVRFPHQNAGVTGSAANDPVQGSCFS